MSDIEDSLIKPTKKEDPDKTAIVNVRSMLGMTNINEIANLFDKSRMYLKTYIALNFNRADERNNDSTKFVWYLYKLHHTKMRDIVSIKFYSTLWLNDINNTSRNRMNILIEEFRSQSHMMPNGRRYHVMGEMTYNNNPVNAAYADIVGGSYKAIKQISYNQPFNYGEYEFNPPMVMGDKITLSVADPFELVTFPKDLSYDATFDFTNWPYIDFTSAIPIGSNYVRVYFTGFTTNQPITDKNVIDYINNIHGFSVNITALPYYINSESQYMDGTFNIFGFYAYWYGTAYMPAPVGTFGACKINIISGKPTIMMEITYVNPAIDTGRGETARGETVRGDKIAKPIYKTDASQIQTANTTQKKHISAVMGVSSIDKLQYIFNKPSMFKRVYVSLDTTNALETSNGSRVFKWNVEETLKRNVGTTAVAFPIKNIVGMRIFPIKFMFNYLPISSENILNDCMLLIHEFKSQSFIEPDESGGINYHFNFRQNVKRLPNYYVELQVKDSNNGYFWFNTIYRQVTTLTLELMQRHMGVAGHEVNTINLITQQFMCTSGYRSAADTHYNGEVVMVIASADWYSIQRSGAKKIVIYNWNTVDDSYNAPAIALMLNPNGLTINWYAGSADTILFVDVPGLDAYPVDRVTPPTLDVMSTIIPAMFGLAGLPNIINLEFITL